jgi:hypothetical protein
MMKGTGKFLSTDLHKIEMMLEGERERGGEEDKSFVKRIKPQTVR